MLPVPDSRERRGSSRLRAEKEMKALASRKPTVARGAVIARTLIRRWAQRTTKQVRTQGNGPRVRGYLEALADLDLWLHEQPARTKRSGGIGR